MNRSRDGSVCMDALRCPESIYMPWKGWDFRQKKQPSEWMSFCIERIGNRIMLGNQREVE